VPENPEPRVTYAEHAPHPALARHVDCYWTARFVVPEGDMGASTVLPDGCMDILFSLADEAAAEPYVVGAMTRPLHVSSTGVTNLVGIRFKPGGTTPYLALPAAEITDAVAPLDALWGSVAHEAHERLEEAPDSARRVEILDDVLLARLDASAQPADERILSASELVSLHDGNVSVEALAGLTGLGRRQLERRFLATVGTTPKVAARIARFQSAVARLQREPQMALSHLAYLSGYADQAHLTREFKALSGDPPGAYRDKIE
jgi:AraC-like DNA-binding protein